ncbi:DUF5667 domain-containing protein [Nocardioides cynanchi]|uniref:DUF5667 domain-containing protein n=1 Tax=Nocardioides cynanchi TaxID=2558918 RepID=UPI00124642D7|nr:DUF5667 domain-containing protein [Nocardioides cynanchi]
MITARRAREFHELVEGDSTSRAASYADLLAVVGGLRATPAAVADPAFVAALRDRLITEAETVLAAAAADQAHRDERLRLSPSKPQVRRRNRRLAAAISGVVLVGGSATVAIASQSALPGDGLYPIKRGIENAQAGLTFDRAARGQVLLDSASTRLDEATALSRSDADPSLIDDALTAFSTQAATGSDLLVQDYQTSGHESSITAVRTFTADSMARLRDLQTLVPAGSLPSLLQAAQALDQVQSVATHTCPTCSGPSAAAVPTVLAEATRAATGPWVTGSSGGPNGPHHHSPGTPPSGPHLPHVGGNLPPGSVTQPPPIGNQTDIATSTDVQHTLHDLTGGLTAGTSDPLGSTVADTTGNVLDAVGQVGNTVTGAIGDTVGGLASALPSDVTSNLPQLP